MAEKIPVVYTDDPDAGWRFTVTDGNGQPITWTPVEVAVDAGDFVLTAAWVSDPAPTRTLRVPLDTLPAGYHTLYLRVPDANDVRLGGVAVYDRT